MRCWYSSVMQYYMLLNVGCLWWASCQVMASLKGLHTSADWLSLAVCWYPCYLVHHPPPWCIGLISKMQVVNTKGRQIWTTHEQDKIVRQKVSEDSTYWGEKRQGLKTPPCYQGERGWNKGLQFNGFIAGIRCLRRIWSLNAKCQSYLS